ncbi:hypothetical protein NQ176_g1358 [Zarea fungicola]|uniref:Uncharacterized protein n=1 Tax=Zarea fungicola TaxID=93591 RepID=A0ACC1NT17_9HYPO|nr:hypothetical protein NQ176_g1358 [Lecanicillium fungicola]
MAAATNASNSSAPAQSPLNPLTMMDFDISGVAHATMPQLLGWAINSYAPLMLVLGAFAAARSYIYQFKALLEKHFTSEVLVKPGNPPYDWVAAWVFSKGLNKTARSTIARVSARGPNPKTHVDGEETPIWFAPWNDNFFFWFQGNILFYKTRTVTLFYREEEEISIKCYGRSATAIHKFLAACRKEYLGQNQDKTVIFSHRGERWRTGVVTRARSLSNVILPEQTKRQLVDDLNHFTETSTRAKYNSHDTPYRRGYLFYGPPGTGKSSLIMAVAGHWKRDLYVVSIPGLNDERLQELFDDLPEKCIVLLEDIDAVGASRVKEQEHKGQQHSVSLSGLLNAIDGVATQEGRILIMTTNHVEKLDPALIREGRIDLRIELTYADLEMTRRSFEYMYTPCGEAELQSSEGTLKIELLAHQVLYRTKLGLADQSS